MSKFSSHIPYSVTLHRMHPIDLLLKAASIIECPGISVAFFQNQEGKTTVSASTQTENDSVINETSETFCDRLGDGTGG